MKDCLYGCISLVAHNWNVDHKIIGADAWGFWFEEGLKKNNFHEQYLWYRVHAFGEDSWKSLELFGGIKVKWKYNNNYEETIDTIENEIADNRPVIISINTRFCPWHPRRNEDNIHFCLVVGVDKVNTNLKCIDPSTKIYNGVLPFELLKQGYGVCVTLTKVKKKYKDIDWKTIVGNSVNRLMFKQNNAGVNAFDSMRHLADGIHESILEKSTLPLWISNPIPMVISIDLLINGRKYYSATLEYLGSKNNNEEIVLIAHQLEQLTTKWKSILFFAYKCQVHKEALSLIPEKLREIASEEEKIAEKLKELVI